MKKLLSVLLTIIVLASFSVPAFAATGPAMNQIEVLSGVTDKHTDLKTGVYFEAPEEWALSSRNIRHGATGNGTSYTTRTIYVYSSDYNYQIKLQQTGKKSSSFVVTILVGGMFTETYFLSNDGLMLMDETDRPHIGEPVTATGSLIDPTAPEYLQWKAVQSFLLSLSIQK